MVITYSQSSKMKWRILLSERYMLWCNPWRTLNRAQEWREVEGHHLREIICFFWPSIKKNSTLQFSNVFFMFIVTFNLKKLWAFIFLWLFLIILYVLAFWKSIFGISKKRKFISAEENRNIFMGFMLRRHIFTLYLYHLYIYIYIILQNISPELLQ